MLTRRTRLASTNICLTLLAVTRSCGYISARFAVRFTRGLVIARVPARVAARVGVSGWVARRARMASSARDPRIIHARAKDGRVAVQAARGAVRVITLPLPSGAIVGILQLVVHVSFYYSSIYIFGEQCIKHAHHDLCKKECTVREKVRGVHTRLQPHGALWGCGLLGFYKAP